jgi:hypothetical protein
LVFSVNSTSTLTGKERRRSERLFESLPLIVRGTDLLGQPFEERTSTLSFNLHGCQYTSKHHLPRNSWVTIEMPDAGSNVRARVAWVQRPHSIRDFFQVAVELERPTNVWKQGALPENWSKTEMQFPTAAAATASTGAGATATTLGHYMNATLRETTPAAAEPFAGADSGYVHPLLRELRAGYERAKNEGIPAAEMHNDAEGIATGMTASGAESRASEAPVAESNVTEMRPLGSAPGGGVSADADDAAREARQVDAAGAEAAAEVAATREAQVREFQSQLEQLRSKTQTDISELMAAKSREFNDSVRGEIDAHSARAQELLAQINKQSEELRAQHEAAQQTASRIAQARLQLEGLESTRAARQDISKEFAAAGDRATADWRKRLEAEMSVAQSQWNELLQGSLDSNLKKMVEQLSERSTELMRATEKSMTEKLDDWREPFAKAASEARANLTDIQARIAQEVAQARGSLADVEQAAGRTKEFSSQIEAATHDSINELHRRLDTILNTQTSEMNRRAEGIANNLTQRLTPTLDAMSQQFVDRSTSQIEASLAPHMDRLPSLIRDLNSREAQAEESLRLHRERLRQASDNNQREAAQQMSGAIANLQSDFENARKQALTHWTEELDSTGVRAAHATAESMGRSSEWFQQEARARLQVLVEQELVNAGSAFFAKTGEASQQFVTTLAGQSAEHLDKARTQVEGVAAEASERAKSQVELAAQAAAASFGTVLEGVSSQQLEQFNTATRNLMGERTQEFNETSQQLLASLKQSATETLDLVRGEMRSHVETTVGDGRNALAQEFAGTVERFRGERDAQHGEWSRHLDQTRNDASQKFQDSMQTASDNFVASAMRRLNEHGQNGIEGLLRNADQALREAFSKVFEGLAESLRDRTIAAAAGASVSGFGQLPPQTRDTETTQGPRNEIL